MSFETIQVGDKVIVYPRNPIRENLAKMLEVTKVTKTTFTAGSYVFMRVSGRQKGALTYPLRARLTTDENVKQMEEYNKRVSVQNLHDTCVTKIRETNYKNLPLQTLLKVVEILQEAEEQAKG